MTRPALAIVACAVLLFAPAASAKEIAGVLVVGADGRSVDIGGGWSLYDALRPAGVRSVGPPSGSYLLVYPLMRGSVPIEPARYFSDSAVGCWSWSLALEGCVASTQLPATWTATRTLTPLGARAGGAHGAIADDPVDAADHGALIRLTAATL